MRLWCPQLPCDNSYGLILPTVRHDQDPERLWEHTSDRWCSPDTIHRNGVFVQLRFYSNGWQFSPKTRHERADTRTLNNGVHNVRPTARYVLCVQQFASSLASRVWRSYLKRGESLIHSSKSTVILGWSEVVRWKIKIKTTPLKYGFHVPGSVQAGTGVSVEETLSPAPVPAAYRSFSQSRSGAQEPPHSVLDPVVPSLASAGLGHYKYHRQTCSYTEKRLEVDKYISSTAVTHMF